jgi:hypothetical protein
MFSALRNVSQIVGFLFAAPLGRRLDKKNIQPQARLTLLKSIPLTLVVMIIQWQVIDFTPKMMKIVIFYTYTAVVYASFQFILLKLIPKMCAQKTEEVAGNVEKPKED